MIPETVGFCLWVPVNTQDTHYLQHVNGTTFVSVADLDLADELWVLRHQQVYEFVDLR